MSHQPKNILIFGIAAVLAFSALFTFLYFTTEAKETANDSFIVDKASPVLGVYDPEQKIKPDEVTTMPHYTYRWAGSGTTTIPDELKTALQTKNNLLLTIEMWDASAGLVISQHGVLQAVLDGDYDEKFKALSTEIANSKSKVYLRWNPEMEVPVAHYPWQNQSPKVYIEAFRHVANLCKKTAPNISMVWGSAGYPGTLEYWPGADVVDISSITLKGKSELLSNAYPQEEDVTTLIKRKLHRLRFTGKPALVIGSEKMPAEAFKKEWLLTAAKDIEAFQEDYPTPPSAESQKIDTESELLVGVFDPKLELTDQLRVSVEHLFTDWKSLQNGSFRKEFKAVVARGHDVIVTMEPWKDKYREHDPEVLQKVLDGKYDKELHELYAIISGTNKTVYLRWAHEMEIPITRYPWQSQDPMTYIKAYRYVANLNQRASKNIKYVWGPAGDRGSLEWWPGDDVVDYISIAIYGLPDKNITDHNQQESFSTIFRRKLYRMRFVNKPIFITEFGVKGPDKYKKTWLAEASKTINSNPQLKGICYFNLHDSPKAWGEIQPPDWSVSPETFQDFTSQLSRVKQVKTIASY